MKKTSRKNLIALLCTFALGCANVEKSQAFLGIFGTKKPINFVSCGNEILKNYQEKWAEGISEIYQNFYEETKKTKGLEFEIIDSNNFCSSEYTFNDPNRVDFGNGKKFNIVIDRDKLISKGPKNDMSKTPFRYFEDAGIIGGVSKQSEITNLFNFSNVFNQLQNNSKTFGDKIKDLSYNQEIVFKNNYGIIKKNQIIPTIPLKSIDEIKKMKSDSAEFQDYGLTPLIMYK